MYTAFEQHGPTVMTNNPLQDRRSPRRREQHVAQYERQHQQHRSREDPAAHLGYLHDLGESIDLRCFPGCRTSLRIEDMHRRHRRLAHNASRIHTYEAQDTEDNDQHGNP